MPAEARWPGCLADTYRARIAAKRRARAHVGKHYPAQFKAEVVLEVLREEKTLAQIGAERHVHPTMLHQCRNTVMKELPEVFARGERRSAERAEQEKKVHELYAEIGRLSTELEWLKKTASGYPSDRHSAPCVQPGRGFRAASA